MKLYGGTARSVELKKEHDQIFVILDAIEQTRCVAITTRVLRKVCTNPAAPSDAVGLINQDKTCECHLAYTTSASSLLTWPSADTALSLLRSSSAGNIKQIQSYGTERWGVEQTNPC